MAKIFQQDTQKTHLYQLIMKVLTQSERALQITFLLKECCYCYPLTTMYQRYPTVSNTAQNQWNSQNLWMTGAIGLKNLVASPHDIKHICWIWNTYVKNLNINKVLITSEWLMLSGWKSIGVSLMISSVYLEYEINMSRNFLVITSHQKCWQASHKKSVMCS